MTEAVANIPWMPACEAIAPVACHLDCTPEAAKLQIVGEGKASRIKARGVIKGPPESWGFPISPDIASDCQAPVSLLPAGWNGTMDWASATMRPLGDSYEITNLEVHLTNLITTGLLRFIDLITTGLLPAPEERARWAAEEAIAYLVTGFPFPWKTWQWAGAAPAEIEQAEIDLGEAILAGVPAWGWHPLERRRKRIPSDHFRAEMIERKEVLPVSVARLLKVVVRIDGTVGTSPLSRTAEYSGPRWQAIEVDSAALRQARPGPLTAQAAPIAPPPRPPDGAPAIEHVAWAVRFLQITAPDRLIGLRGKKLQKLVCNTVGSNFSCGQRTFQRGKKRADSM